MKLMHLSDLHLGKRVNGFSMVEDQGYILAQILQIVEETAPDAVLLAGDIYDRSIPPTEAVGLLDNFMVSLSQRQIPIFAISGNHDSPERLAFASRILQGQNIHISPVYTGEIRGITITKEDELVDFYLLPFLKPVHVKRFYPDDTIETYTDAVGCAIAHMDIDPDHCNVLLCHQFVAGATRCDSEELSIGGTDCVSADVFAPFDYVALGHLHGPQAIAPNIRYCGTPLKYSISERNHHKSVTMVEITKGQDPVITTLPLVPLRNMVLYRGTYLEVSALDFYQDLQVEDYCHITLTDEEDIPDALSRLRAIYPNLMSLDFDNKRTRSGREMPQQKETTLSPMDLFSQLYAQQNGDAMSQNQLDYLEDMMERIWEGEV